MRIPLVAIALGAAMAAAAAQDVPRFDARPGCQAGARTGVAANPDVEACMSSEMRARDELAAQWREFESADKRRCVGKTHVGGPPSYVEVLTCLEIARDVKKLPKDDNTGLGTGLRPRTRQ